MHLATNGAPKRSQLLANLDHRALFEEHQLPTLLQAVADINHRQLSSDNDRDNLVKSVPLALRKLTRELKALQDQLNASQTELQAQVWPVPPNCGTRSKA